MADIFDDVAVMDPPKRGGGDVFDEVAGGDGDMFDQVAGQRTETTKTTERTEDHGQYGAPPGIIKYREPTAEEKTREIQRQIEQREQPNPLAAIPAGLGRLGRAARGFLADFGEISQADDLEAQAMPYSERFKNTLAGLRGEKQPIEKTAENVKSPALNFAYKVDTGMLDTAPQLAAVMASGPASPAVAGYLFGYDDEGKFHPAQAVVGAALPIVGKLGGGIAESIANKLPGLNTPEALAWVNAGGRYATANAVVAAQQAAEIAPEWAKMSPEEKKHAITDGAATILVNGLLGLGDLERPAKAGVSPEIDAAAREALRVWDSAGETTTTTGTTEGTKAAVAGDVFDEVAAAAAPISSKARTPRAPKVTVPEGETDPRLAQIRKAGADTTAKVQALFPDDELTREDAARLRRNAFEAEPKQPNKGISFVRTDTDGTPQFRLNEDYPGLGEAGQVVTAKRITDAGYTVPTVPEPPKKVAPVEFAGEQPGFGGMAAQGLWNLTEDVPGLGVKGSTLSERTILKKGWSVPARVPEPTVSTTTAEKVSQAPALTPAIQVGGKVFTGENHSAIYESAQDVQPDMSGMIEGFVDKSGKFFTRSEAAAVSGLPTGTEPGKLHSEDLGKKPERPIEQEVTEQTERTGPGKTAAMGASAPALGTANAAARNAAKKARAQGQAQGPVQTASKAVAGTASQPGVWFKTVRSVLAPKTLSPDATVMAGILRKEMGEQWRTLEQADFAMREYKREFDKTPVPRNWKYPMANVQGQNVPLPIEKVELPHNYAVMAAIDTGNMAGLTEVERRFAKAMRAGLDQMIEEVHAVSPGKLQDLLENYMPRLWERPEANVNAMMQLNAHSPWEGSKGFLKQRILDYFTDGLRLGLKPVTDNPAELYTLKLGEMARFVAARRGMEYAKAVGIRKFKYVYEKPEEGWVKVQDPSSSVYAPPVVEAKEAFDEMQRVKTLEMLDMLGIPHERLARIGGKRWGMAQYGGAPGTEKITTKFGGSTFVYWHEFGHIMDGRYPDLREATLDSGDREIQKQLRKLSDARFEGAEGTHKRQGWWVNWKEGDKRKREFFADETQAKEWAVHVGATARPGEKLSGFGQYVRRGEEKMAHLFEDYLNAPQKFQQMAPDVWKAFNAWLDQHPEVKNPLNDIRPSMKMGTGTTEIFTGGPVLLGDWMMPEGAAQVLHNYLMPGLGKYKWFRGFRDIASTLNSVQLFGGFHAQNILNDALYTGPSLALYDLLTGHPFRGAKELARTPVSPAFTWSRGRKIQDAIRNPEAAAKEYNQAAQWAVEQNMRTGHGQYDPQMARHWVRAIREFAQAPSTGAAWEALWRTPFALLEKAMGPIMDGLVKPMKHGTFERMARRIVEDNPDVKLEDLRPQLAAAADQTDNTLGQNVYDNAFQNRVMKDVGQLVMRSYGWQFNHYRMMGGAAYDWVKYLRNPKPVNVTFRMTYLPSMVAGHAIMAASLGYLMFGQKPRELMDYFFMRTGKKDEKGNEIRVSFADFMKDTWDDWRSFPNLNKMGSEWSRKLAPMWNMAAEMYQNRDFYGTEIFSSRQPGEPWADHVQQLFKDAAEYLGKQGLPFSATSGGKYQQAGISPAAGYAASALGYNIASRRSTQTAAEGFFEEKLREQQGGTRSKSEAAQALARSEVVKQLMAGGTVTSDQYAAAGGKSATKGIEKKLMYTPIEQAAAGLPSLENVMQGWDLANDDERAKLFPIISKRIQNEAKRGDKANPLVSKNLGHWQQMLVEWAAKQEAKKQARRRPTSFKEP